MKNRVDNYLKLTIRGKPERSEPSAPLRLGRIRLQEMITVNTVSAEFDETARDALDLLFAEVAAAHDDGLVATLSAFDVRPFRRFLRPGEVLPQIGEMQTSWGLS